MERLGFLALVKAMFRDKVEMNKKVALKTHMVSQSNQLPKFAYFLNLKLRLNLKRYLSIPSHSLGRASCQEHHYSPVPQPLTACHKFDCVDS